MYRLKRKGKLYFRLQPPKKKQAFKMSKLYHNHITSDETRARLSAITSKLLCLFNFYFSWSRYYFATIRYRSSTLTVCVILCNSLQETNLRKVTQELENLKTLAAIFSNLNALNYNRKSNWNKRCYFRALPLEFSGHPDIFTEIDWTLLCTGYFLSQKFLGRKMWNTICIFQYKLPNNNVILRIRYLGFTE